MYTLQTKVPKRIGVLFVEVCKEKGKTPYQCLKELVYKFLIEQGHQVYEDAPVEAKIEVLKQRIDRIEKQLEKLEKEFEKINEKLNKQGIASWMTKR